MSFSLFFHASTYYSIPVPQVPLCILHSGTTDRESASRPWDGDRVGGDYHFRMFGIAGNSNPTIVPCHSLVYLTSSPPLQPDARSCGAEGAIQSMGKSQRQKSRFDKPLQLRGMLILTRRSRRSILSNKHQANVDQFGRRCSLILFPLLHIESVFLSTLCFNSNLSRRAAYRQLRSTTSTPSSALLEGWKILVDVNSSHYIHSAYADDK